MAYIDVTVFVSALASGGLDKGSSSDVLDSIARGRPNAMTSSLSWDELVHVVARLEGADTAAYAGRAFLRIPHLALAPVDRRVVTYAQDYVRPTYGLAPRDSIHAATAILLGQKEIYSHDRIFDKVKELKRIEPK